LQTKVTLQICVECCFLLCVLLSLFFLVFFPPNSAIMSQWTFNNTNFQTCDRALHVNISLYSVSKTSVINEVNGVHKESRCRVKSFIKKSISYLFTGGVGKLCMLCTQKVKCTWNITFGYETILTFHLGVAGELACLQLYPKPLAPDTSAEKRSEKAQTANNVTGSRRLLQRQQKAAAAVGFHTHLWCRHTA